MTKTRVKSVQISKRSKRKFYQIEWEGTKRTHKTKFKYAQEFTKNFWKNKTRFCNWVYATGQHAKTHTTSIR